MACNATVRNGGGPWVELPRNALEQPLNADRCAARYATLNAAKRACCGAAQCAGIVRDGGIRCELTKGGMMMELQFELRAADAPRETLVGGRAEGVAASDADASFGSRRRLPRQPGVAHSAAQARGRRTTTTGGTTSPRKSSP